MEDTPMLDTLNHAFDIVAYATFPCVIAGCFIMERVMPRGKRGKK
jgi:hypothetical protein